MSNYNKVLLMGRLTRDPELRWTQQGTPVSEIGIAMNREYTVGTERRKETTFVDVTFWRRQAEVICQYLRKGSPIFVEGRLTLDSWETQEGQKRSRLRVVGDNFQFLGSRSEGESYQADAGAEEGGGYGPDAVGEPGYSGGSTRRGGDDWGGAPRGGAPRGGSFRGGRPGTETPARGGPAPIQGPQVPSGAEGDEGAAEAEEGPLGLQDKDIPF